MRRGCQNEGYKYLACKGLMSQSGFIHYVLTDLLWNELLDEFFC